MFLTYDLHCRCRAKRESLKFYTLTYFSLKNKENLHGELGILGLIQKTHCVYLHIAFEQCDNALEMSSFVALDFETSDYSPDSACAIGLVRVEKGVIVREYSHLIKPPRQRMRFTDIHGITWADVADKPTFGQLWKEIAPFFNGVDYIVAHNAPFDRGVLHACCEYYAIAAPSLPFKCTVRVARNFFDIRPAKLSNVCKVLGIELNHHEALSDARACAQIMIKSLQELAVPKTSQLAIV